MSFRFRKSVKLMPGVRLNFSRSGVSTTFGARGMSVNVGKRGTFLNTGIPGTGIHHRSRIGGGRSGAGAAGGAAVAGCAGCGIIPVMFLVVVGMCSAMIGSSGGDGGTPSISIFDTAVTSTALTRETLYAHGSMNIRSGASTSSAVVRTLTRGESVTVGPNDGSGWAPAFESYGGQIGYIYRASNNLRPYAPATRTHGEHRREPRTRSSRAIAICRDGTPSYSAHRRGTCSHHGGVSIWM